MRFADNYCTIAMAGRTNDVFIEADLPAPAFRNAILRQLGRELREPLCVRLPPRSVLRRTVRVPVAALPRLRSAIGLQIERLCPFKAEAVAYSCIAERPESGDPDAAVDVAIVTLATLEEHEAWLAGIGLSAARFETDEGAHVFAPTLRRLRNEPRHVALAMAAAGLLLILAAYAAAPALRASELELEAQSVARLRAKAGAAVNAKDALDALSAPLASVADKERVPKALDVLKIVTLAFPKTARLQELVIDGGKVRASGTSADARPLVAMLRRAPQIVSADLEEPIEHTQNGLDRFVIELSVRP